MKLFLSFALSMLLAAPCFGAPATNFTLRDQGGKEVQLSDYKGKIVVLEWTNPECPFVKRHYKSNTMENLAAQYSLKGVVWLAINSSSFWNDSKAAEWVKDQNLSYPVLNDSDGKVGKAYGAKTTPHMFIVGTDGEIAYQGAIDDDSYGESSKPVNYVALALDELLASKKVTNSETKPYGCSVKYLS